MPGPLTPLGAQWLLEPAKARLRIVVALRIAKGNAVHAAKALGVSHRTLCRRIAQDGELRGELAKIRAAKGAASDTDVIVLSARKGSGVDERYDTGVVAGKNPRKKRTTPRVA